LPGWKFVKGRFPFLEQKGVGYKVLKGACVAGIGFFYGFVYLIVLVLRFIDYMAHFND
jgi:hypothetical protein